MAVRSGVSPFTLVGNQDQSVSHVLKVYISNGLGLASVVGLIGEGSGLEMQSNWESPFEQDSIGSWFGRIGGLLQMGSSNTSKTTLNSAQVWMGNRPVSLNLVLHFYACSNPMLEVEKPLKILKMLISPEVNQFSPIGEGGLLGQAPAYVSVSIGRAFIFKKCVVESVSEPFDVKRDSQGHRLNAVVNVSLSTAWMLNRTDIPDVHRV